MFINCRQKIRIEIGDKRDDMKGDKKIGMYLLSILLVFGMFGILWANQIYERSCADGTGYFQCSQESPGYACLPDSSAGNGLSLQNDITNKIVKDVSGNHKCACANFAGYAEKSGKCVKTTCIDTNGAEIQDRACSATKPKRCVGGELADDANACGCPGGQQMAAGGKTCEARIGCRWGTKPCAPGYECTYM
ncbi:MAG: hypothetical protein ABIH83_03280, partial [Candidatus Micrarchaeota archaeon]